MASRDHDDADDRRPPPAGPEAAGGSAPAGGREARSGEEVSDDRLVADARDGDVRALETLLVRHEPRVLRVLRLLGVPPGDREDVAQEVLIRVFRHLGGFRAGQSFSGWLYRIAVNAAHDQRTRTSRLRRRETGWSDGLEDRPDAAPGPGDVAAGRDRARQLEGLLDTLTERERAVFVLCELEGLESKAVGKTLGISGITVRRHLGRARRRLRDALEADDAAKSAPTGEKKMPDR